MSKFKVGDLVESKITGKRARVTGVYSDYFRIDTDQPRDERGYNHWKLISPPNSIEEAQKILSEAGFTVIPPKPKLTGKVYLYSHPVSGFSHSLTTAELGHRSPENGANGTKLIAVVDWTEGDGL